MRVALDYRPAISFPHSGIGRQTLALEAAIAALPGVELQLFSTAPAGHPLRQRALCPDWSSPLQGVHRLPLRLRFEAGFLPHALREQRIDVHVCNFNMGLPLPTRPPGVRYVLQLHDLFQLTHRNRHASSFRAMFYGVSDRLSIGYSVKVADRIWTPSQFTAGEVARWFPAARDKIRVLPNLVSGLADSVDSIDALGLPSRYWLAVGTREPRKNIPWFIEAWQAARQQHAAVPELVLVGAREELPQEQRQLAGLHVVHGLSDAQLRALYQRAQRLWQPAYAEGFGLPVVEALGQGTPVAVARGSALDEVAPPEAPRFDPRDGAALSRLMETLAQDASGPGSASKEWAARFAEAPYRANVARLLDELRP